MDKTTLKTPLEQSEGKMIIAVGLTKLVEDEGCTPHEAFDIVDKMKSDLYFALNQIYRGEA